MPREDAGTYLGMCHTATEKNDYVKAKEYALKAYMLDSNRVKCSSFLGTIYLTFAQYDSAHYMLRKAFSLDSLDELTNYHLGMLYFADIKYHDYKKSEYHFEKSLQVEPDNPITLFNLGMIAYKGSEYEKAKKYFLRFVQMRPNDFSGNEMLGSVYQFQKNFDKAKYHYEKAISINPKDELIHRQMNYMLGMNNEPQAALKHAEKAVDLNKNGLNYFDLAKLQLRLGDKYNARKNYLMAVELQSTYKSDTLEKILGIR